MKQINYTQISNEFIESMFKYSESEVKIFIAISRKTIGWHKESDRISYSQLKKITGLSINYIKKGIKNLIKDKWITQEKTKNGYVYDLNIVSSHDTEENELCHSVIQTISHCDTDNDKTISPRDTTKEIIKETNKKNSGAHNGPSAYSYICNIIYESYSKLYNKKLEINNKEGKQIKLIISRFLQNKPDWKKTIDEKIKILEKRCRDTHNNVTGYYVMEPGCLLSNWNRLVEKVVYDPYRELPILRG